MSVTQKDSDLYLLENRIYFENRALLRSVLACHEDANLELASNLLGVKLVARDCWIAVPDDTDDEKRRTFLSTFEELKRLVEKLRRDLSQSEFVRVIQSSVAGIPNDIDAFYQKRIILGYGKKEIIPRTEHQMQYILSMRNKDLTFGIGPAGTGKTFLAIAMGLSCLLKGEIKRLILTRPAVEAGENLGFLPGTLQEKINPYLRPLYDAMHELLEMKQWEELLSQNIIEAAPLAFMRGRTLGHAFVILDEAQNASREQMLMFLTRLGNNSKCVVCGDPSQVDLGKVQSGLLEATLKLQGIEEIGICEFGAEDVIRHPLVETIIRAYQRN